MVQRSPPRQSHVVQRSPPRPLDARSHRAPRPADQVADVTTANSERYRYEDDDGPCGAAMQWGNLKHACAPD